MINFRSLLEGISTILEGKDDRFYHGSTHLISTFSTEFVGSGNDQHGPGIYFSDQKEDALYYAKKDSSDVGYIYECTIDTTNFVDSSTPIDADTLLILMENTPDSDAYTNWSDSEQEAYKEALKVTKSSYSSMDEALLAICYDWYQQNPKEYLANVTSLGIDGILIRNEKSIFAVVYNPHIVKVLNSEKVV